VRTPPSLLAALAVLVLAGSSCGTEGPGTGSAAPSASGSASAASPPAQVPSARGEVTTRYPVTVLDDGDGAELCVGGVADSLPPQCGGPRLVGWDWADHQGDFESRGGVRWGDFLVTGTFDGTSLTPTEVVPGDQVDPPAPQDDADRFATPCPEPEGGWRVLDPAKTTQASEDRTFRAAERLEGYAYSWVDQSINPVWDDWQDGTATDSEAEQALDDPALLVINVKVTGDPADAERTLRETWGGSLCVTRAQHTQQELMGIAQELFDLPGSLGGGPEDDWVDFQVLYDDGSYQAWADTAYGAGTVVVTSALVDAG